MSVIFANTGLRIFHILTEVTFAGINLSDPDKKNNSSKTTFMTFTRIGSIFSIAKQSRHLQVHVLLYKN